MMGTTTETVYIPGTLTINQSNYSSLGPTGATASPYQLGYQGITIGPTGPFPTGFGNTGPVGLTLTGPLSTGAASDIGSFTLPVQGVWYVTILFTQKNDNNNNNITYASIAVCTSTQSGSTLTNVVLPFYYFTNITDNLPSANSYRSSLNMSGVITTTGLQTFYVGVLVGGNIYYNAIVTWTRIG
jgi:hypothetical protein